MKIILASNSPRRKELLKEYEIDFEVIPSNVDEVIDETLNVYENVMNLAKIKCLDVFKNNPSRTILAADTIVVYNNQILGKPKDDEDAFRMLSLLSGKTHEVITAVAVANECGVNVSYEVSKVVFKNTVEMDKFINKLQHYGRTRTQIIFSSIINHRKVIIK